VHTIAGALDTAIGSNPTAILIIKRKGSTSVGLSFTLNPATSTLEGLIAELNPVTLSQASEALAIAGWKNTWLTSAPATAYQGLHAFALDIPETAQLLLALPQGTGYGTLTVTRLGLATIAGHTGDGSAFTTSAIISKTGKTLLYKSLYKGQGSIFGTLPIASDTAHRIDSSDSVDWRKKTLSSASKDRLYPVGFNLPLTVSGGLYIKPTALAPVVMGLSTGSDNAQLSFVGEGFDPGFTQLCSISAVNIATFTPANNPKLVDLKITPTTGAFSGKLTLNGLRLAYAGQLIPHPALLGKSIGYGTYLIPAVPVQPDTAKTSPISARQVVLEATPVLVP
jgi:hypothetical protein